MPKPRSEPPGGDEAFPLALAAAHRLLAKRDLFESALRNRLSKAGFDEATVVRVLDRLRAQGIVRDERAIASRLAHPDSRRPMGRERLRAKLAAEGAPEMLIETALDELDPADEVAALESAMRARYRGPGDAAKAARWAIGRGFGEDVVQAALARVFAEAD